MKKIYTLFGVVILSIALVACGNAEKKENTAPPENNNTGSTTEKDTEQKPVQNDDASVQGDMQKQMDDLDYAEFNLEVEYADQTKFEVELDKDDDDGFIEAEIKDSIHNVAFRGEEAFNEFYPKLKELGITQQTTKEEAIGEVLKVFKLEDNYREFEIEIKFKDGTKIEFEDKK